ncbi:hypothetical protein D3C87_1330500 [compost metagenome]
MQPVGFQERAHGALLLFLRPVWVDPYSRARRSRVGAAIAYARALQVRVISAVVAVDQLRVRFDDQAAQGAARRERQHRVAGFDRCGPYVGVVARGAQLAVDLVRIAAELQPAVNVCARAGFVVGIVGAIDAHGVARDFAVGTGLDGVAGGGQI